MANRNPLVIISGVVQELPTGDSIVGAPVTSVAGKTGVVTLSSSDVGLGNVSNTAQEPLITKSTGYAKWNGSVWTFADETYSLSSHTHSYQPLDADLTSIAGLASTTGLLKKTAADTWTLDTTAYTTNTGTVTSVSGTGTVSGLTLSGTVTGSGNITLGGAITGFASDSHTHNYAGSSSAGGAANSIANAVTFNNSGTGVTSGSSFNGSSAVTISYNTIGAAASSHTHGNITNAGAIGSTSGLPIITTTSGVLTTGSFGTTAGTFCQGNDGRIGLTTNALTFSNGGAGDASGSTFNGSAARTISYNSIGAAATGQTFYIGTTQVAINRGSGALSLTGVSIDGSSASCSGNAASSSYTIDQAFKGGTTSNWNTHFTETAAARRSWTESSSGGPSGTWWFIENMRHSNGSNQWGKQYAHGWEDNANRLLMRNVSGGTWSGWVEFVTSSNIGAQLSAKTIAAQDGTNEGGELIWAGAGSYSAWTLDVYQTHFRMMSNSATDTYFAPQNLGAGLCHVYADGNVTAYSDERLKKDWSLMATDFVARLAEVKSGTYSRIDGNDQRQVGVSAQSLREVLPEAVMEDTNGTLTVAYGNAALAACVELAKEVVELKERIKYLEGR